MSGTEKNLQKVVNTQRRCGVVAKRAESIIFRQTVANFRQRKYARSEF